MSVPERIAALRTALHEHQLDAYVVPSTDPHRSEYPAPRWAARAWLSGFTGSAGTLVVTPHEARLWTDSRYFIQAESELAGSGIELMRLRTPHTPEYADWLVDHLLEGQVVGVDGRVFSARATERLAAKLSNAGLRLRTDRDLLDEVWADRPGLPRRPVFAHDSHYSGEDWPDRMARLVTWMEEQQMDSFLVSALDELAWLLNLRGGDIDYNPLMVGYLVVNRNGDHLLFAEQSTDLRAWVDGAPAGQSLEVRPYRGVKAYLRELNAAERDIGLDPETTSSALFAAAGGEQTIQRTSPIGAWKSIKNATALNHLREVMRHDAVALLRLRRWLDTATGVREHAVERKLSELRADHPQYVTDSFGAIVGYGGNGAIVHYHATADNSATIGREGLLLLDSGGQYHSGTTDITRTFALGEPTAEQRRNFTLVLIGHIDLATAHFPVGTSGVQLDALARHALWRHELNYGHGTGHGVGFFLNVHEGPAGISANPRAKNAQYPLAAGMLLSNEPGYYKTGEYGIRIENLIVVREGRSDGWLCFETVTLFPIDRRLIDRELLDARQLRWLNEYHARVLAEVGPLLTGEEREWLARACAEL